MFDMDALHARKFAERAAKGLASTCGIACATQAEKDYRDFRHAMTLRDDWKNLPADLEAKLIALKCASRK